MREEENTEDESGRVEVKRVGCAEVLDKYSLATWNYLVK